MFELIKPHETWAVNDMTKVGTYMRCPREFFYAYVLGWRPEQPSIHLCAGGAIHDGLEHIYQAGSMEPRVIREAAEIAVQSFLDSYQGEVDAKHRKSPDKFLALLIDYSTYYKHDFEKLQVIEPEIAGTVLIEEADPCTMKDDRFLFFKMDTICHGEKPFEFGTLRPAYFSLEHKTGSGIRDTWIAQWSTDYQMAAYTHVLYSIFEPDEVWGVEVNGIHFVSETQQRFIRIPVRKELNQMESWLWEINTWMDAMDQDWARLDVASDGDPVLAAFPKNDKNCIRFMQACPYLDFCSAWANPLQRCAVVQDRFVQDYWDPRKRVSKDTKLLTIRGKEEINDGA